MSTADIRVVSADALGDLEVLEPLARAIFGDGRRPDGWFARKLHREVVSKAASGLVVAPGYATDDPAGWLGYGLLGLPPSLRGVARTSGIGLRPGARGLGMGARLLGALKRAAHERGRHTLEVPASADSLGFYARVGLQEHARTGTWVAFGRGAARAVDHASIREPGSWDPPPHGRVLARWLAEAWDRTPSSARYRWGDETQALDVSMEGIAHVVHRWTTRETTDAAAVGRLARWLEHLPAGAPALLSSVPNAGGAATLLDGLESAGWVCVQRSVTMRGPTAMDD